MLTTKKLVFTILAVLAALLLMTRSYYCNNYYENSVVGEYYVNDFRIDDTSSVLTDLNKIYLKLSDNKTFSVQYDHKEIHGIWEADDSGDFTWIEFKTDSSSSSGRLYGENYNIIDVWDPSIFGLTYLKSVEFKRQEPR
ncbi:MAG: hypothetical protein U0264_10240 [Candidatus Kapaibacterium sp.]